MKPSVLPTPDEINVACEQGKQAVKGLFERQAVLIRALEVQIQALEEGFSVARRHRDSSIAHITEPGRNHSRPTGGTGPAAGLPATTP